MKRLFVASALMLAAAAPAFAQAEPGDRPDKPRPAPVAAAAPGDTGMATVYNNALGAGWELWQWDGADTVLGVDLTGSARKPIRVEAQGYKGLYLHHAPFSTAPFRGVSMLVQSVGAPGEVRLIALVDGKPIADKMKVIKLQPGGWTKVDVPLSALGAENVSIDGLWIQNNTGDPSPRFYVTEIALMQ